MNHGARAGDQSKGSRYPVRGAPWEDRMRNLTLVLAAIVALSVPAGAQTPDAQRQCAAANQTPEQQLQNCTTVIEAGQDPPQSLAIAYRRRGNIYLNMRDFD